MTSACETLGVQLRYRYEFKPLSYLYVVYGARRLPAGNRRTMTPAALIRDGFSLRDDEQLLVKF